MIPFTLQTGRPLWDRLPDTARCTTTLSAHVNSAYIFFLLFLLFENFRSNAHGTAHKATYIYWCCIAWQSHRIYYTSVIKLTFTRPNKCKYFKVSFSQRINQLHASVKRLGSAYLLTPWCRVLTEKLTGLQLVKKFPAFLWNPKFHYRTHKRPPAVPVLGQPNPVHIPTSHLLEIHPNIIHSSTPRSPQWSLSLRFPHQEPIRPPLLTHTRHPICYFLCYSQNLLNIQWNINLA